MTTLWYVLILVSKVTEYNNIAEIIVCLIYPDNSKALDCMDHSLFVKTVILTEVHGPN